MLFAFKKNNVTQKYIKIYSLIVDFVKLHSEQLSEKDGTVSCSNRSINTAPNHLQGSPLGSIYLVDGNNDLA